MKDFDTRVYSISDLVEWNQRGQLELSPDFQRRSVWSAKAKSYLVDTIIRGKPIPKLLLTQDIKDRRNIRVVVDGQQRLRAILDFVDNQFKISRAHNKDFAGKIFDSLPDQTQDDFMKYEVGVDLLYDMPYRDILDIFARLNTYTMRLNGQELLNSQYVGFFKQLAYTLGYRYLDYLLDSGIVTRASVTRMAEAELTSDILASLIDGPQTNKSIEGYYRRFDDEFADADTFELRFDAAMGAIEEIYPAKELANTNWSRIHLFYTLFNVVSHGLFGLKKMEDVPRPSFTAANVAQRRIQLDNLSAEYDAYSAMLPSTEGIPADFAQFIQFSRRGTTDTQAREYRAKFVARQLADDV
ncbi:DUF262 domain-containing protein [Brevundimonas sp.]|uniref:DUF262 domain-containing protein n=1 Tax=Brevundimonas sp. TaxID=1871086 RepID=UPI0027F77766|nr:DUF262 domain-containing protein [Brevundimonas sp.]MDQ7813595.1 DUF262 domain-containing protein [Brevundimonas sp.]